LQISQVTDASFRGRGSNRGRGKGQPTPERSTGLQKGGPRTRGGPTGLHRGGSKTMGEGIGQFLGTIHIVRLYGPSLFQTPQSQSNASVSKLFIILFHCCPFNLICILLLNES
jgi:hypothetical protein